MPISQANVTSLTEQSTKIVFPIEDAVRSKIPLWMKFYCYEFANTATSRAVAYTRSGGGFSVPGLTKEKAQIMVPAPPNFQTQTAHNYDNMPSTAVNLFQPVVSQIIDGALQYLPEQISQGLRGLASGVEQGIQVLEQGAGLITPFISEIPHDVADTTYIPTGASRSFEIRMNLPCLTEADSKAAGAVIRAFEALSLPTARSLFSISSTKFFHPPLWVFGIGPADSFKFDPDWTGQPQISVLRSIAHKKTAFETNSLSALGGFGLLKPVAYTLTLVFQELEPAFRRTNANGPTSLSIINRSGVLATTGTSVSLKGG